MRVLSGAVSAGPGLPPPAAGAGQPRGGPHQHPRHREAQRTGGPIVQYLMKDLWTSVF